MYVKFTSTSTDSGPVRYLSSLPQRGATLTGYALILSLFGAAILGAVEGLNSASDAYLTETSQDISAPRELALYDELQEIPDIDDGGGDGIDAPTDFDFQFDEDGQFQSSADGFCITLDPDGHLRQRVCNGSTQQLIEVFTDDATKTSQLRIAGQCIGLEGNSSNEGTDYVIQPCDEANLMQVFRRTGTTWESATNRDPIMCLDITGGGGIGQALHQWECEGQTSQDWPDPGPYSPPPPPPTPVISGEGIFVGPIPAGTDFVPNGAYEDDDNVFVFTESQITLDDDMSVGGTTIPAGTTVCSYIVWYDPVSHNDVTVSIDFGAPVLAGAQSRSELQATDAFASSDANYRGYNRPWEGDDEFNVSGTTVGITPYAVPNNADMLRVFTDCG